MKEKEVISHLSCFYNSKIVPSQYKTCLTFIPPPPPHPPQKKKTEEKQKNLGNS